MLRHVWNVEAGDFLDRQKNLWRLLTTVARRCEFSCIRNDVSEEPPDDDDNKYIQGRGHDGGGVRLLPAAESKGRQNEYFK